MTDTTNEQDDIVEHKEAKTSKKDSKKALDVIFGNVHEELLTQELESFQKTFDQNKAPSLGEILHKHRTAFAKYLKNKNKNQLFVIFESIFDYDKKNKSFDAVEFI